METREHEQQQLPTAKMQVQFMVRGRSAWLSGTFDGDHFRSRWAAYTTSEVDAWRRLELRTSASSHPLRRADTRYWSERPVRGL